MHIHAGYHDGQRHHDVTLQVLHIDDLGAIIIIQVITGMILHIPVVHIVALHLSES